MRGFLTFAFLRPSMILPGIAPTYVLLCPRISASSFTPPRHIRTYSLLSDCATERAILVFPVPGGPTRQIIGTSALCDTFLTASVSSILSLTFFIP